ncbi:S-layer homology domain-containing protein [Paenibacillus sp. sgz5001063]|uniref:S-layer homology domain-containing protein n=1 Tax=Paenibacillus sp. sgz5001063 TaxID=3242474 RepID=UPI0036D31FDC
MVFVDLGKVSWAQSAIENLVAQGIIQGRSVYKFAPTQNISRAEFVTLLVRALNLTSTGSSATFSDVNSGAWYSDAISIAVNAGLVQGSGSGKFEPGREITREEMAIMVANALRTKGQLQSVDNSAVLHKYDDQSKIASYAQESVAQLTNLGIINGISTDQFEPKGNTNRAQAAVIIYRILNLAS